MDILAKVIYSESRGEPYVGQVAVGAVVMNRIQSSQFPDNIKEVVFQKELQPYLTASIGLHQIRQLI